MIDPDAPIANIVLDHSAAATVFDRRHIDYCCEGHHTLSRACRDRGLDLGELTAELEDAMTEPDPEADPRTASTSALISRALARQHRHLRATLALLHHVSAEQARDHGQAFPVLRIVASAIENISDHLLPHLDHEEDELFPALIRGEVSPTMRQQLAMMFDEHRVFSELFHRLRDMTGGYRAPDGADEEVVLLMRGIAELESLVNRHHHLENHVLLPRFA